MSKTCEHTRSEDGANLTSALREYEKLWRHTADVSKPPQAWRLSKGRHGTLIGPVANGTEAHILLMAVSRSSPNNPTHTILLGTIVWMVVLVEHEPNVMSGLGDRPQYNYMEG